MRRVAAFPFPTAHALCNPLGELVTSIAHVSVTLRKKAPLYKTGTRAPIACQQTRAHSVLKLSAVRMLRVNARLGMCWVCLRNLEWLGPVHRPLGVEQG